ncbi:MAG: hypothetical protein Q8S22_01845 [Eubacteriales bacterium]|nr:hypothetical protein [Eubacteriales bacterium]
MERSCADPESVLHFYRKLIRFRKENDAFIEGDFRAIYEESNEIGGYQRILDDVTFTVICNFSESTQPMPELTAEHEQSILLCNRSDNEIGFLKPYEALVLGPQGASE